MMGGEMLWLVLLGASYADGARELMNVKRAILRLGFEIDTNFNKMWSAAEVCLYPWDHKGPHSWEEAGSREPSP